MDAPAASLSGLPLEIMEFVVEQVVAAQEEGSLARLAQTCRDLHAIAMPRLYNKKMVDKHPGLIFWAAHFGRLDTARRLVHAGVDLNRGMIRNETMANVLQRIELGPSIKMTPTEVYTKIYGVINNQIGPHEGVIRVGPRGFVGEPFRPIQGNDLPSPRQTARWHSWWFPIHLAVQGGYTEMLELFLANGAFLDVPSGSFCGCRYPTMLAGHVFPATERPSWTALHTAICSGHDDIAKTLLSRGASVSLDALRVPFTVLHNAAYAGSLDLVKFIIDGEYQTGVQAVDLFEVSSIWHAYLQGHWDVVDELLARGANIDDDLATGYTPLVDACLFGDFAKAKELVSRGADVNVACTAHPSLFSRFRLPVAEQLECLRGHRPIDLLCSKQQRMTRSLRYRKFQPTPRFYGHHPGERPPVHHHQAPPPPHPHMIPLNIPVVTVPVPEEDVRTELVRALLDAGADFGPCKHSPLLVPPLVSAAAEHLLEIIRLLLDRGAAVDATDKEGNTPLMAAMNYSLHWCNSHAKTSPLSARPFGLQRPRPDVPADQQDQDDSKPRSCRKRGAFQECVKLLIERGANPIAKNDAGASPITLVYSPTPVPGRVYKTDRQKGHLTFRERAMVVSMLIELGADPNTIVYHASEDDNNSDVDSDNFSVYSGSGSDSDTSRGSASDAGSLSSGGGTRNRNQRRPRSLYKCGPLSVLQCAFWDGDLDLCRTLLKGGARLTTPIVAWMLQLTWGYCRYRMRFAAEQILQVLGDMDVDLQAKLASHPACLLVLIGQRVKNMAEDLLLLGIERAKFDEYPDKDYEWLASDSMLFSVTWGSACLYEAVKSGWVSVAEALLKLGIDPNVTDPKIPSDFLANAIDEEDLEMVELLIRYGANVNLCDEKELAEFPGRDRRNPMMNAIRQENSDIMAAILAGQKEPMPEKFSYRYIREAYMMRSPKALSSLLNFDCLDAHAKSNDGNTHLVEVMQNIAEICNYESYDDDEHTLWAISIRVKLERVRRWMECLILLVKAGISAMVRNKDGVCGLELFGEIVNYSGPDRFKTHVRLALRSRLNDVMGEEVSSDVLDPEKTLAALATCEVDLVGTVGTATSSSSSVA